MNETWNSMHKKTKNMKKIKKDKKYEKNKKDKKDDQKVTKLLRVFGDPEKMILFCICIRYPIGLFKCERVGRSYAFTRLRL